MTPQPAPDDNHGTLANKAEPASTTYAIGGQTLTARKATPGLHVVATPIGNLGDITLRALETLAGADLIACEDTRVTRRLLERFAISTPMTSYHEHNAAMARPKLIETIARGGSVALVSDAGTPLISDPGYKLVHELATLGHAVTSIPGPSSVMAALSSAGLPTDRFLFEGFLPPKQTARRNRIAELADIDATLVLFEGGSRVLKTLADLAELLPDRETAICRELTKLHEEILRGPLPALAAQADALETRGEFVIVIGPPTRDAQIMSPESLDEILTEALQRSSLRDAVAEAVEVSGRNRREVYARALELSRTTTRDEP
jgi:16S rRNA (cytidine1402-2'-O)-methyltransferase